MQFEGIIGPRYDLARIDVSAGAISGHRNIGSNGTPTRLIVAYIYDESSVTDDTSHRSAINRS